MYSVESGKYYHSNPQGLIWSACACSHHFLRIPPISPISPCYQPWHHCFATLSLPWTETNTITGAMTITNTMTLTKTNTTNTKTIPNTTTNTMIIVNILTLSSTLVATALYPRVNSSLFRGRILRATWHEISDGISSNRFDILRVLL